MAGRRVYRGGGGSGSGSDLTLLIHNQMDSFDNSLPLDSSFLSGSSSSSSSPSLLGPRSMVSFEDVPGRTGMKLPIFSRFDSNEENSLDDYDLDAYSHQPEKKRRLTANQVHFLEKSFEIDNKLEPESKTRLAKELGLQPRQVAIWFQNRRARYKTKQLEKDYDILQGSYNCLKTEYENLLKEKEKLKSELIVLKDKWGLKEKEIEKSEQGEYVISSGKGDDVFEYDSHHYHSDLSQNEEDTLIKGKARLFPSYVFPKIEDVDYSDPSTDSGNFGFESVAEDYSALWSWSYCGVV